MDKSTRATRTANAVSLLLAGSLCLLPFLLPYHQQPLLSFQAEWLAGALGCATVLAASFARRRAPIAPPAPALWLAAFALVGAMQAGAGIGTYPQAPILAMAYALLAALLAWTGAILGSERKADDAVLLLASCLLAGAFLNAAAGMLQFYGLPEILDGYIARLGQNPAHNGAYGNIAQPNLYANYLALGLASLAYLNSCARLSPAVTLAAGILLSWACALSGARAVLLFALWLACVGGLGLRRGSTREGNRIARPLLALAALLLAAQWAVPAINDRLQLGPPNQSALVRLSDALSEQGEARWHAWAIAWQAFLQAPVTGIGIGEFAGAAFDLGLHPTMARGEVWRSAHSLPLDLLAETGLLGAIPILMGLTLWSVRALRAYLAEPRASRAWIIAAVGVEIVHSLVEFPLWSAHFLGVTALLLGCAFPAMPIARAHARTLQAVLVLFCAGLAAVLALALHDYLRLDATRASGAFLTLASKEDQARDRSTLRALSHGLFAPQAETWIFLGANLDRDELDYKLSLGARVARVFPSNAVIAKRAGFLALDGQAAASEQMLSGALRSFPHRCRDTLRILELAADRRAIQPLLERARTSRGCLESGTAPASNQLPP